jgi:polyribonucleotide nucleotidyltransferase
MDKTIREPRETKKHNTPEIETLTIPSHKRGRFLGIGGVNLKKILAQTGNPKTDELCFDCTSMTFRCDNLTD